MTSALFPWSHSRRCGHGQRVTLFNCFVMRVIPDSLEGIFSAPQEGALTMQQDGGVGYDFFPWDPVERPLKGRE